MADETSKSEAKTPVFPYIFRWDTHRKTEKGLISLKGSACRVLKKSMQYCHVEFEDGYRIMTNVSAVRRSPKYKNSIEVRPGQPAASLP